MNALLPGMSRVARTPFVPACLCLSPPRGGTHFHSDGDLAPKEEIKKALLPGVVCILQTQRQGRDCDCFTSICGLIGAEHQHMPRGM